MDAFEKVRDELLKKQLGENYKEFEKPRKNMPTENDMGPLPKKENKSRGIQLKLGPSKKDKPTDLNPTYKKGGMTASSRADGCAVRGKTRA